MNADENQSKEDDDRGDEDIFGPIQKVVTKSH